MDAGFCGTLLSGFGLECPSHSTEPIVVLDSQGAGDDCHEGVQDTKMNSPAAGSSTGEASAPSASVQKTSGGEGQAGPLPMTAPTAAGLAAEKKRVKNEKQKAKRQADREANSKLMREKIQAEQAESQDRNLERRMFRKQSHVFKAMKYLALMDPEQHQSVLNGVGGDINELLARARESARAGSTQ